MIKEKFKKYWWIGLLIIYIGVLVYRIVSIVPKSGYSIAEISMIIAILQTIAQNSQHFKRIILKLDFFFNNIQIGWKYSAEFKAPESSMIEYTEAYFKSLVQEVLEESEDLKKFKNEIKPFRSKNGFEIALNFMPLGVNLYMRKSYADNAEEFGENNSENIVYLKVVGDTLLRYRDTKVVLDQFITTLFSKLESKISHIYEKNFNLSIESVETDSKYFKKLFLKGLNDSDIKSFNINKKPSRYEVTASDKRINITSQYREDLIRTAKDILFRLTM